MKLRTNYKKNDWIRFISTVTIFSIITFPLILVSVQYVLVPSVNAVGFVAKFLNTDGKEQWEQYLKEKIQSMDESQKEQVILSALFSSLALPVIIIFGFSFMITKFFQFGFWVPEKLKLAPNMDLVVIKNEKFWFRIKA